MAAVVPSISKAKPQSRRSKKPRARPRRLITARASTWNVADESPTFNKGTVEKMHLQCPVVVVVVFVVFVLVVVGFDGLHELNGPRHQISGGKSIHFI